MASSVVEWKGERDIRLMSGKGCYIDDVELPNMVYCLLLGSTHAHARIKNIDVDKALRVPGVIMILTGKDLVNVMDPLPANADYRSFGWHWRIPKVYPLATDKVRFMGEPVAAVIAEDPYKASDALGLIEVEYEPLPVVIDAVKGMEANSPLLYDEWGDNIQAHVTFNFGDIDATFSEADRIIKVSWRERRVSGFPIEPRGCVAWYDGSTDTLNVWSSTQTPLLAQQFIARALRISINKVRVVAPDVGGAFGNKLNWWKDVIVCAASIITGRPIKWFENRRENFATGPHQRDVIWHGEVAVKDDGRILGVKAKFIVDVGVEGTNRGAGAPSIVPASCSVPNAYKIKALHVDAYAIVTNKSFYCAYRGYGKDKGIKFMERIVDIVGRELNVPPEEVRFRNFIQPNEFPYKQISGYVYDSGDYPHVLKKALEMIDINTWRDKRGLRGRSKYLGIGMAFTVEPGGGAISHSIFNAITLARIKITPDGTVEAYTDQTEIGQGSKVVTAQVVSDILGVKITDVVVHPTSSDITGAGPWSSRGAVYSLSAAAKAAKKLRERVFKAGSKVLNEDIENIEIKDSTVYSTKDPSKRMSMKDLALYIYFFPGPRGLQKELQLEHETLLDVSETWFSPNTAQNPTSTYTTYCSSADIAVVEVDVGTGDVEILRYVHVHDAGKIINREVVEGQIHGGVVQGIGEALSEDLTYDESGRLLAASYMDYVMPTALDAPNIEVGHVETLSPFTELGTKGMGEAPAIGSKVVIINAIEDALSPFNIVITDAPATKEKIWRWVFQSMKGHSR